MKGAIMASYATLLAVLVTALFLSLHHLKQMASARTECTDAPQAVLCSEPPEFGGIGSHKTLLPTDSACYCKTDTGEIWFLIERN